MLQDGATVCPSENYNYTTAEISAVVSRHLMSVLESTNAD